MNSGIINLSDNLPASQLDVLIYAYTIMNKTMPEYINYSDISHEMSNNLRRFWENKNVILWSIFGAGVTITIGSILYSLF